MNTKKITIEYDSDLINGDDARRLLAMVRGATENFRDHFYEERAWLAGEEEEEQEEVTADQADMLEVTSDDDEDEGDDESEYQAEMEKVIPGAAIVVFGPEQL
jgi:hypothetical protein